MRERFTESVLVRLTSDEHRLVTMLASLRHTTSGDVLRELLGLPSEEALERAPRTELQLVASTPIGARRQSGDRGAQ